MSQNKPLDVETIRKLRCRVMMAAMEYVFKGYSLHDAIEAAEIDADTEDMEKFYKAGGKL